MFGLFKKGAHLRLVCSQERWAGHPPPAVQHLNCLGWLLPRKTGSWTRSELGLLLALAACSQILDRSTGAAGMTRTRSPTPAHGQREAGRWFKARKHYKCTNCKRLDCGSHHPVNSDKVFRLLGPNWKLHVTHGNSIIAHPKLVFVAVHEHLRQVVELWDQLLTDTTEIAVIISFHFSCFVIIQYSQRFRLFFTKHSSAGRSCRPSQIVTFTSAVSLWQFLHERPIPEKALSGWSNLLSFALRKNVVNGSYRKKKSQSLHWIHLIEPCPCFVPHFPSLWINASAVRCYLLFWASTEALNEPWSIGLCSGGEENCHHPRSRSVRHKTLLALDSVHRLARRQQREVISQKWSKKPEMQFAVILQRAHHTGFNFQNGQRKTYNCNQLFSSKWSRATHAQLILMVQAPAKPQYDKVHERWCWTCTSSVQ